VTALAEAVRIPRVRGDGVGRAFLAECRKLSSQLSIRLLALVCALGPFVFGAVLRSQSGSPTDTLFGVWVHSSGFAVALVLLAFAGSWGFPLIAGIVAGDLFSSEDRHGTWKMVLTRSRTRGELFAGKVLAAAAFTLALVVLLAISSLLAGLVFVGAQSLVGLSGTTLPVGRTLLLVLASWLLCALPALAFASLAVLLSVATRNGIAGVIGPSVAALAMQLLTLIGSGIWAHMVLVSSALIAWHPLLLSHPFYGPLLIACAVSIAWIIVSLSVAWLLFRPRDFAGESVGRPGWLPALRAVVAIAAVVTLLAVAGNWGSPGVTAARLTKSITPAFNDLTLLQQRELGRHVPPGAKLLVKTACSRRGSKPAGPGDWVCTLNVFIPQLGAVPFQQTPVAYEVSVNPDGCYKATSPPSFVGSQTMRDARGHSVVNPLFTIYGCVDTL
jgi:ABC-2 type transport system permease protein